MHVGVISLDVEGRSGLGRLTAKSVEGLTSQVDSLSLLLDNTTEAGGFRTQKLLTPLTPFNLVRNSLRARGFLKDVDVVHAFDVWPYGVYGLVAVIGTRKRLVVNGIGTYSVAPLYQGGFKAWLARRVYARATAVPCIGDFVKEEIARAGIPKEKLSVVHMGTTALPDVGEEKKEQVCRKYQIPNDAFPIITTVGAIKNRKGQFDTLRAVIRLREEFPAALYVVVGKNNNPSYVDQMKEVAAKVSGNTMLRIIENISDEELAALYAASHVFALNSVTDRESHHFEGFGLVILEAAHFGLPAVGSRDSGIQDAIVDGVTGYLSNQQDVDSIAAALRAAAQKHTALGAAAREFAKTFTWEKTATAYIELYGEEKK